MAKTRRVVRKLKPTGEQSFDEQLWPIYVALAVLTAMVAGVILAAKTLRWDHPQPQYHTAVWLIGWLAVAGGAAWLVWYADQRRAERRFTLSLMLSLLIFISLMEVLRFFNVFQPPWMQHPEVAMPVDPERVVTAPAYQEYQIDPDRERPRQDFERPVETETADVDQPEDVTREQVNPEIVETRPQVEPDQQPQPVVEQQPIERRRPTESAPRRADQPSRLARQMQQAELRPAEPIEVQQPVVQPQRPARVEARDAPLVRRDTQVELHSPAATDQPATIAPQPTPQIARRQSEQAPTPQSTTGPSVPRRVAEPLRVPRTAARVNDVAGAAQQTRPDAVRPNDTRAERQATVSPQVARSASEPTPNAAVQVGSQATTRQQPAEQAPQLAAAPQSAPNRRARTNVRPDVSSLTAPAVPSRSPRSTPDASLRPSSASVARGSTDSPQMQRAASTADAPSASPVAQVAQANVPRTRRSTLPTIDSSAPSGAAPRRTEQTAQVATTSQVASRPATAETSRAAADPTARPARQALTKSVGGTAGIGTSPNLGRDLPAPPSSASVASASATRARAMQQMPAGPAMAPSAPARLARSRAGNAVPSATYRADVIDTAQTAGAEVPAEMSASASAAIQRAAAAAPQGPVTGDRGATDVDLGPTRIVSSTGNQQRSAGGGQLAINFDTQSRSLARTRTGGAPSPMIIAQIQAADTAAPPGDTGGQPAAAQPSPDGTAVVRTDSGGPSPTSAGPTAGALTGPAAEVGRGELVGQARIGRSESIEAALDVPTAGGGTTSPSRARVGPALVANTQAELIEMAGGPTSSGSPDGAPLTTQGTEIARGASGQLAPTTGDPVGALAGPTTLDAPALNAIGAAVGERRTSPGEDDGPALTDLAHSGQPLPRSARASLPSGVTIDAAVDAPAARPSSPDADPEAAQLVGGLDRGSAVQRASGAVPVLVDAADGPGGLGTELAPTVGLMSRRARTESEVVSLSRTRFVSRSSTGATLDIASDAVVATDAFRNRGRHKGPNRGGGPGGPSAKTEEAIERGLVFLARHQSPDGSWSLNHFGAGRPGYEREQAVIHSDAAATSLALLAFLGAGYHHKDDRYQDVVGNGLDYLLKNQKENGDLYISADAESDKSAQLYTHALGAIAFCEAYGMTQDPQLREAAQKAIDFIVAAQDAKWGGWRYQPGQRGDTSVTGWMMMALKSGQLAGLDVPSEPLERIQHWLDTAQASGADNHKYRYNPFARESQSHGRIPNLTMTSVGLLMRLYSGRNREDELMTRGADFLMENLPEVGTVRENKRDTYYWYYATQVMFHMKGEYWQAWNGRLHPMLVDAQVKTGAMAGSWDPRRPVPDRWGPHAGRIYVTTMNLLSLEVYYRHLPIYEETAK